jgi:2-haloalkanoic acid dehalogenase type II
VNFGIGARVALSVRALFFDVFGTLVDWRSGVAREAETVLKPLGHELDWLAFADAWRAEYQPAMEEVRTGRLPFSKLDVLHRHNLERILPSFGIRDLDEESLKRLNLAWHHLDAWPDVTPGLLRLKTSLILAPVSNGNISLMVDLARRNSLPWDAILGAEVACVPRTSHVRMKRVAAVERPRQVKRSTSRRPALRIWPGVWVSRPRSAAGGPANTGRSANVVSHRAD